MSRPSNKGLLEDNERVWGAWDAKEARSRGIGGGGAPLFSNSLLVFLFFRAINLARSLGVRVWQKGIIILTWNAGFSEAHIDSEDYCILRYFRKNYKSVILVRKDNPKDNFYIILTSQEKSLFLVHAGENAWFRLLMRGKITSCITDLSSLLYM